MSLPQNLPVAFITTDGLSGLLVNLLVTRALSLAVSTIKVGPMITSAFPSLGTVPGTRKSNERMSKASVVQLRQYLVKERRKGEETEGRADWTGNTWGVQTCGLRVRLRNYRPGR